MTTKEEALEQGWQTPVPTFFGKAGSEELQNAYDWLSKCHHSPWVLVRRTTPPAFVVDLKLQDALEKQPIAVDIDLPMVATGLRPRPLTYMYFGDYR